MVRKRKQIEGKERDESVGNINLKEPLKQLDGHIIGWTLNLNLGFRNIWDRKPPHNVKDWCPLWRKEGTEIL